MNKTIIAGAAVALGLAVAGCGGATNVAQRTAATNSATSIAAARKAYVADALPVVTQDKAFAKALNALPNDATDTQLTAVAQPFVAVLEKFESQLEDASWPTIVRADATTLAGKSGDLAAALVSLESVNALNESSVVNTVGTAASAFSAAATTVRHDLHLTAADFATK